jgi:hypothetical protein
VLDLDAPTEPEIYMRTRLRVLEVLQRDDIVAVEGAVMPEGQSIGSRLVLYGIRAIILQVACENRCTIREYMPQVWRGPFMGATQAPRFVPKKNRRGWLKARAQMAARDRGWGDVGPDEADALGIMHSLKVEFDYDYARLSSMRGTLFEGT